MEEKIPMLTCYSGSHSRLYENYFYPSFLQHLSEDFSLTAKNSDQICNGNFGSFKWNDQMKEKITFVNQFIQQTTARFVVFSDVDVIFFKNMKDDLIKELNDYDMAFQSDSGNCFDNLCCGFFICRVNERTRNFFINLLTVYNDKYTDQQNLNFLLKSEELLKFKSLSKNFFNLSFTSNSVWTYKESIPYPDFPISIFHANFSIGTVDKEYLLANFLHKMNRHTSNLLSN